MDRTLFQWIFDSFEARSFRGCGSGKVYDEVAACCDPGSVWFVFSWADGAHDACVGDGLVLRDLLLGDEEDSVGAFDAAFKDLGKAA